MVGRRGAALVAIGLALCGQREGIGREQLIQTCRQKGCKWGVPAAVDEVLAKLEDMTVVTIRDGSVELVGDWRAAGEELGGEGWCAWADEYSSCTTTCFPTCLRQARCGSGACVGACTCRS